MFALSLIGIIHAGVYEDLDAPADVVEGGYAGGSVAASTLGAGCKGYVWSAPDHRLNLDWAGGAIVAAEATEPMALVAVRVADGAVQCTDFADIPTLHLDVTWSNQEWDIYTAVQTAGTHPAYDILAMGQTESLYWRPNWTGPDADWQWETAKTVKTGCVANTSGMAFQLTGSETVMVRGIEPSFWQPPLLTLTNTDTGEVLCADEEFYLGGDTLAIAWPAELDAGSWVLGATKGSATDTRTFIAVEIVRLDP